MPARILLSLLIAVGVLAGVFLTGVSWLGSPDQGQRILVSDQDGALSSPILVKRVIDGDTIELASGALVRYIGIDTPELRHRVGKRWVKVYEPYAQEAYEFNRQLVEEKWVRLELDLEHRDRYGRLLAYIYTGDDSTESMKLVNAELVKAGLARVMSRPPNLQYADLFYSLQQEARASRRGVWEEEVR